MKIERFEDIIAWQKAKEMTLLLYEIFHDNKDFGFRDQIQRASVSVMNNIAEGFERNGKIEFRRFLIISKASCGEVRSMLYLAFELRYVSKKEFDMLYSLSTGTSRILSSFITKI